jgi:hypothetical protein
MRAAVVTGVVVTLTALTRLEPIQGQPRPLPSEEAFYPAVVANLAKADREQYRYAYRERRSEVHTNPFGRIGTGGLVLYDVTPGKELGIYQRRLIERDGKPVAEQTAEVLDRRSRGKSNPSIDDVIATLDFRIRARQVLAGRDTIVIDFAPKKESNPKTRQGKIAKAFKGSAWVDEATHEVTRVEATSTDSISYGLGFVARLGEGTRATLARERIDSTVWLPTSIRLTGDGRALLVRKLTIDYVIEWFNYRRVLE